MRLDELCLDIVDCEHKTAPVSMGGGYFAVGTPAMQGNIINFAEAREISQGTFERWTKRLRPAEGDLLFAREAPVGPVVRIPPRLNVAPGQRTVLLRPNPALTDSRFLYYAMASPRTQQRILDLSMGSTVPHLNVADVRSLELLVPPLADQQAIAEVLGALDDKIVANAALRGVSGELTAAMFDRLFAERPSQPLTLVANVNANAVKRGTGALRYLDIASVVDGTYVYPQLTPWSEAPGRARRLVKYGDTVWSTVRPNRRSHALVLEDDPRLIASTGLATISPRHEGFSFVHEATRTSAFTNHLVSNAIGSAYPAVTASKVADAPVPLATTTEINEFNAVCDPIWERAEAASRESRALAELRDTLLPTLMDGTIRVKDAVATAEEVL
jgi:type I restriction enzyme, S subunit